MSLFPDLERYSFHRRRVKYARISINYDLEVRIVIPLRFRQRDLDLLLREKSAWIQKNLSHYKALRANAPSLSTNEALYLGSVIETGFDTSDKAVLDAWYKKQAKQYFTERIVFLAEQYGFTYSRLTIRSARTRWGSCSLKKNISLNWHLIKAPEFVIDYVMLHELVHTTIMNHSQKFWSKVAEVCPRYKEANRWLKEHGNSLH